MLVVGMNDSFYLTYFELYWHSGFRHLHIDQYWRFGFHHLHKEVVLHSLPGEYLHFGFHIHYYVDLYWHFGFLLHIDQYLHFGYIEQLGDNII